MNAIDLAPYVIAVIVAASGCTALLLAGLTGISDAIRSQE